MDNSLTLILWFLGLWTLSVGIAYAIVRRRKADPIFMPSQFWRLRTEHGSLRARFIGESGSGYLIEAPMSNGAYVPLRPGEPVYVEAPGMGTAMTFHAKVVDRDKSLRTLTLKRVSNPITHNRREDVRVRADEAVRVNGVPSILLDSSEGGAKVITGADLAAGDLVRLEDSDTARTAWVLEVLPDTLKGRLASRARLIFTEPTR